MFLVQDILNREVLLDTVSLMQRLDLTGQSFGKWTALRLGVKPSHWVCRCACGTEKEVFIGSLRSGDSTQCVKCQGKQVANFNRINGTNRKHGMHRSPEYKSWRLMKARCYCTTDEHYLDYGARGIRVCDRWKDSFENFFADMGKKPSPKHTIDRIDVNGDYTPMNCRWATMREQNRNKQRNLYVEVDGVRMLLLIRCG